MAKSRNDLLYTALFIVHIAWKHVPEMSPETLCQFPLTKRCILEAIRLRSPGVITRAVMKTFTIKGYTVPAGDQLMLSPYWAHRNPKYFPEPDVFKPERWEAVDVVHNQFLEGFVAFGGGRYQCPGRWFGLLEIHMLVAMLMSTFNIELLEEVPTNSPLHLVGTQQPTKELPISYTRKSSLQKQSEP